MKNEARHVVIFTKFLPLVLGALLIISVLVVSGYFKPVMAFNGQPLSIQAALMQPGDCVDDADGANDEPGQKDLTRGCIETASRDPVHVSWNWDITGLSGNNSADGCALFDTDLNGLADYAVCNSLRGTPPVQVPTYPVLYTCNDTRADRCASGVETPITYGSTCSIINNSTDWPYDDPFTTGDDYPYDTVSDCYIALGDVGFPVYPVNLLDVCSFPSLQENSDPSDCVIRSESQGNLEIHKDVVPDNNATNWLINVTGNTPFSYTLTGDDTTFNKVVTPGLYTITETAGANTSPGYASSWSCTNSAVDPADVISGTGTTITNLDVTEGSVWDCFFTNEVKADITVTKTDEVTSWPWVKRIGTPYMYTLQIHHVDTTTDVTAYDVSLVDTLDPSLDYRSDETAYLYEVKINDVLVSPQPVCTWVDDATIDGLGGTFSCADIGDLGSTDVATVTFWVMAAPGTPVTNLIETGICDPATHIGTSPEYSYVDPYTGETIVMPPVTGLVDICNVVSVATSSPELSYANNQDSEPADIGLPTVVTLGWFDVTKAGTRGITLGWETVNEMNNLGFNIYRSKTIDGKKKLLNAELIPAENPGSTMGALYQFRDRTAMPKKLYFYWLEDVDQNGITTLHGPVKAKLKR